MTSWPPSAVFLDRDGVLNENVHNHVRSWEEVQIFDQAVEAVRRIAHLGVPMVVVTNQSVVGRGELSLEYITELNDRILNEIEARSGARFLGRYMCPHDRDSNCQCRKPMPGMLLDAARDHALDLSRAIMVGDGVTDLQAAAAAGVHGVLVRTGRGTVQEQKMHAEGLDRPVFDDLLSALEGQFGL